MLDQHVYLRWNEECRRDAVSFDGVDECCDVPAGQDHLRGRCAYARLEPYEAAGGMPHGGGDRHNFCGREVEKLMCDSGPGQARPGGVHAALRKPCCAASIAGG